MKRYNFYIDPAIVDQMKKIADTRGVTFSDLLREALDAWMKAQKKG